MHSHQHTPFDILAKGVTSNYNTKPSEQMHGKLKRIYSEHTNFRNVEGQVCLILCNVEILVTTYVQIAQVNHCFLVAKSLRYQLDILDAYLNPKKEKLSEFDFIAVHLGAQEKPTTLASIEAAHNTDFIFQCFHL